MVFEDRFVVIQMTFAEIDRKAQTRCTASIFIAAIAVIIYLHQNCLALSGVFFCPPLTWLFPPVR